MRKHLQIYIYKLYKFFYKYCDQVDVEAEDELWGYIQRKGEGQTIAPSELFP